MTRAQAWCLGFFGALTFYWGAATFGEGFDWTRQFRLWRHAAQAQGMVTARESANHNLAHYEFTVNGRLYRGAGQGRGAIGGLVTVFYLPDDPTFSMLTTPGDDLGFMIIAPLLVSTVVGFVVRARAGRRTRAGARPPLDSRKERT